MEVTGIIEEGKERKQRKDIGKEERRERKTWKGERKEEGYVECASTHDFPTPYPFCNRNGNFPFV